MCPPQPPAEKGKEPTIATPVGQRGISSLGKRDWNWGKQGKERGGGLKGSEKGGRREMEETWGGGGGKRKRVKQRSFIPEDSCQDIRVCLFLRKITLFFL